MPTLRRLDFHTVSAEVSHALATLTTRDEYLRSAAELLSVLLPGDSIAWNAVGTDGPTEVVAHPFGVFDEVTLAERLAALPDDHPAICSYIADQSDSTPRRMSDLVTHAQLKATRTYAEVFAPLETRTQLTVLSARPSRSRLRGWAVNRSCSDFSDAEVDLARAVQPVLATLDQVSVPAASSQECPRPEAAERYRLTGREIEVVQHLSSGLTADAIARLLRISPRTVRKHLENAYAKLECHDRLQVARRARELGLVADM